MKVKARTVPTISTKDHHEAVDVFYNVKSDISPADKDEAFRIIAYDDLASLLNKASHYNQLQAFLRALDEVLDKAGIYDKPQ